MRPAPTRLRARCSPACLGLLAGLSLLSLAGCGAPLQNGEIAVRPGAVARLEMACRFRLSAGAGQDPCAIEEEGSPEPTAAGGGSAGPGDGGDLGPAGR
ncbi:MAG: hypothetical protein U0359_38235 [Byssovorax sp.]